ncbi:hypothetical protein [Rhodopirellula baltica]
MKTYTKLVFVAASTLISFSSTTAKEPDEVALLEIEALKSEVRSNSINFVDPICRSGVFKPIFGSEVAATQLAVANSIKTAFEDELAFQQDANATSLLAFIDYLSLLMENDQKLPTLFKDSDLEEREVNYTVLVPYTESVEQQYSVNVPVTMQREETYTVAVPYTEVMTQQYTVKVRQPDGTIKTELRTRDVPVTKTRMETRTKMVPYTNLTTETRTRTVNITRQRPEVRVRTVMIAKEGNKPAAEAIQTEKAKLCRVYFKSVPQGAKVIFIRRPSSQVETLDVTTDGVAFLRNGDYRFIISKHPLKPLVHEAVLEDTKEEIEVIFEGGNQSAQESHEPKGIFNQLGE